MKRYLLITICSLLIGDDSNLSCDTNCQKTKKFLTDLTQFSFERQVDKKITPLRKDWSGSSVVYLKGTWHIDFYSNGNYYSDTFKLNSIEYYNNEYGYVAYGTTETNSRVLCAYIYNEYTRDDYQFLCLANYKNNKGDWFYFDLRDETLSGKYEYGDKDDSQDALDYGNYDGTMLGYRETYYSTQSCSNKVLTKSYINNLPRGWSLVGTSDAVTNLSIFDNVSDFYTYKNGNWTNKYDTYSIPEFNGVWVYK